MPMPMSPMDRMPIFAGEAAMVGNFGRVAVTRKEGMVGGCASRINKTAVNTG